MLWESKVQVSGKKYKNHQDSVQDIQGSAPEEGMS